MNSAQDKSEPVSVHQLLTGSARLNEMQEEIERVVSIVFGFINASKPETGQKIISYVSRGYHWTVSASYHPATNYELVLNIYCPTSGWTGSVSRSRSRSSLSYKHLSGIHVALPEFIRRMCEVFPEVKEGLEFIASQAS